MYYSCALSFQAKCEYNRKLQVVLYSSNTNTKFQIGESGDATLNDIIIDELSDRSGVRKRTNNNGYEISLPGVRNYNYIHNIYFATRMFIEAARYQKHEELIPHFRPDIWVKIQMTTRDSLIEM